MIASKNSGGKAKVKPKTHVATAHQKANEILNEYRKPKINAGLRGANFMRGGLAVEGAKTILDWETIKSAYENPMDTLRGLGKTGLILHNPALASRVLGPEGALKAAFMLDPDVQKSSAIISLIPTGKGAQLAVSATEKLAPKAFNIVTKAGQKLGPEGFNAASIGIKNVPQPVSSARKKAEKETTKLLEDTSSNKAQKVGTSVIPEQDRGPIWDTFQEALKIARDSNFDTRIIDFSNTVLSPTKMTPTRIKDDIARLIKEQGGSLESFTPLSTGGYSVSGESAALRSVIKSIQESLPTSVGSTISASMKEAGIDPSIAIHLAQHGERGLSIPYRLFDNVGDVVLAVDSPEKIAARMDKAFSEGRSSYDTILREVAGIDEKLPSVSTTQDTAINLRNIMDSSYGGIAPNAGRVVDTTGQKIIDLSTLLIRPGEHGVGKSGHAVESAAEKLIDPSEELRHVRRLESEFINNPNLNGEMINAIVNSIKAGYPIDKVVSILEETNKLSPKEAQSFIAQHFSDTAQGAHYQTIDAGFKAIRSAAGVVSPLESIPSYDLSAVKTVLDSKLQILRRSKLSPEDKAKQALIYQKEFAETLKNMVENNLFLF
jgi:hypothetical protein